ncbi:MAG: DNA cytosine methyltransferase [Dehalococcoidia bacterium]
MKYQLPVKVFDFFSGCGGTCRGFLNVGMHIVSGLDNDPDAGRTFKQNFPGTHFIQEDIKSVQCESLQPLVDDCRGHPILFSGCAPCQPFTKQKTSHRADDNRQTLLNEFLRFVKFYEVEFIFIENVPGLQRIDNGDGPFRMLISTLDKLRYKYKFEVIASQSYGVPQMRRRLVLIASRLGDIDFPKQTHGPSYCSKYSTVRDWIADLPPIHAGETHPIVPNHRAAALSPINLKRIQSVKVGEDRRSWPEPLTLNCHANGYPGHTDVYGRMRWDAPATGLTTRCISLSNGRFGHPEQNRAISVREAARLQTFPNSFIFTGSLNAMARQIGNAVPVLLAERFGRNFVQHLIDVQGERTASGKV